MSDEGYTDRAGTPFDAYPDRFDDAKILVGLDDGQALYHDTRFAQVEWYILGEPADGEVDDRAKSYPVPSGDELVAMQYEGLDRRTICEYVLERETADPGLETLSTYGEAMRRAAQLAGTGVLTTSQAKVYALREEYDVGRTRTAEFLGKSPNTVDNLLGTARRKVEAADQLVDILSG